MSHRNLILNLLYDQLNNCPDDPWVHKGSIERYMMDLGAMGDTTGRRLRELEVENYIVSRSIGVSKEYKYIGEVVKPLQESGMQCLSISDH